MELAKRDFTTEVLQKIVHTGIQGEFARGDNGAVMVDGDDIVYLLENEFQPDDFREKLADMLSEDGRQHLFVVLKKDDVLHVHKIPKGPQPEI